MDVNNSDSYSDDYDLEEPSLLLWVLAVVSFVGYEYIHMKSAIANGKSGAMLLGWMIGVALWPIGLAFIAKLRHKSLRTVVKIFFITSFVLFILAAVLQYSEMKKLKNRYKDWTSYTVANNNFSVQLPVKSLECIDLEVTAGRLCQNTSGGFADYTTNIMVALQPIKNFSNSSSDQKELQTLLDTEMTQLFTNGKTQLTSVQDIEINRIKGKDFAWENTPSKPKVGTNIGGNSKGYGRVFIGRGYFVVAIAGVAGEHSFHLKPGDSRYLISTFEPTTK